jgi:hypothetical protein
METVICVRLPVFGYPKGLCLRLQRLQKKVSCATGNIPKLTQSREWHVALKLLYVYYLFTEVCWQKLEAVKIMRIRPRAHWQLLLLNYLVAWMENIALHESARTGNFSVAAT